MTVSALIAFAIYLIIVGLIIGIIYWVVKSSPIPEPIRGWAAWAILAIGALIIVLKLVSMTGFAS